MTSDNASIKGDCIFCGKPTEDVAKRTIRDIRYSGGHNWRAGTYSPAMQTTTTRSVPFPAHPACLRRRLLFERLAVLILIVTCPIIFLLLVMPLIGIPAQHPTLFAIILLGDTIGWLILLVAWLIWRRKGRTVDALVREYS